VPAERRERTKAYAVGGYVLDIAETALLAAVLAAILAFGLSARMRERALRATRARPLQAAAYWVQLFLVTAVLTFPLAVYRSYFRETAYGLLNQSFGDWLLDRAKGLGFTAVFGALLVMLLYAVLRRAPRTWWLWGAGVVIAFVVFGVALVPVFVAPAFNTFTPVRNEAVRRDILSMARAHGIPAEDVYQVDASRRTQRISAYVNGMLGTTRIVMYDTTLARCTPAEIRMIMGHEMGHYVLRHVWKGIGFAAVAIVAGFAFARWGFAWATARWPRMGVHGIDDLAGLPLLGLLLIVFFSVVAPVLIGHGRHLEAEADAFGLDASRVPDAAATTFLKLGEYRDLEPHPMVEWLLYDHPSGRSRIRAAMEWKAHHGPELSPAER
jgi:STE24 endopeptidase